MLSSRQCTTECIGLHAAKRGTRFEALEPIRQGVRARFGEIGDGVARGLRLRHDHGSNYLADDFQQEVAFFGIESSPSFVREPEGNGVAERFIRTLKENLLWVRSFDTIEELRLALLAFKRTYNEQLSRRRLGAREQKKGSEICRDIPRYAGICRDIVGYSGMGPRRLRPMIVGVPLEPGVGGMGGEYDIDAEGVDGGGPDPIGDGVVADGAGAVDAASPAGVCGVKAFGDLLGEGPGIGPAGGVVADLGGDLARHRPHRRHLDPARRSARRGRFITPRL